MMGSDEYVSEEQGRIRAIARCLAKQDGKHIGSTQWLSEEGTKYKLRAGEVLRTLNNYNQGIRSGGMPDES